MWPLFARRVLVPTYTSLTLNKGFRSCVGVKRCACVVRRGMWTDGVSWRSPTSTQERALNRLQWHQGLTRQMENFGGFFSRNFFQLPGWIFSQAPLFRHL